LASDTSAQIFYLQDIFLCPLFRPVGILAHGYFISLEIFVWDFLVQGFFGTMDMSALGHFGTQIFHHSSPAAKMSVWKHQYCFARCQNIHVLKCLGSVISRAKTSLPPKILSAKMFVRKHPYCFARCQNIYVPKCLGAKISRAKTSMPPKILSAKIS
jgi:hypothetical protein